MIQSILGNVNKLLSGLRLSFTQVRIRLSLGFLFYIIYINNNNDDVGSCDDDNNNTGQFVRSYHVKPPLQYTLRDIICG